MKNKTRKSKCESKSETNSKLVAELLSVPDQTPSAQKKYDTAKQLKEEAETRYTKAQTALDNHLRP